MAKLPARRILECGQWDRIHDLRIMKPRLEDRMMTLVNMWGESISLQASSNDLVEYPRLRASVLSKLGTWKTVTVASWRWTSDKVHINVVELRAFLTALRGRLERYKKVHLKLVHLPWSVFKALVRRGCLPESWDEQWCGSAHFCWQHNPEAYELLPYQADSSGCAQPAPDEVQVHEMPKKGV